jgi:hypothetical protein
MEQNKTLALTESKEQFALAMKDAESLDIVNNTAAAFDAAIIINKLRAVMTDDIMKQVFMPLQGQKIGFRTDKVYPVETVRNCIIDAAANGLMPTGNQFNIIAGNMYPTKEGYTALLTKLKKSELRLTYLFEFDPETKAVSADPSYVAIPCRISYKTSKEDMKGWFKYVAMVKSNGATSNTDQLRGKAERKCKKAFFEFLTGLDLGDGDADTFDIPYEDVTDKKTPAQKAREAMEKVRAKREQEEEQRQAEMDAQAAEYFEQQEGGDR